MKVVSFQILMMLSFSLHGQQTIRVGAKHFNEGYILSEMIALVLEDGGYKVERKFNLGGTSVSFEALRTGAIDVYPEYTGTIEREILKETKSLSLEQLDEQLKTKFNLQISQPYGFNNSYALLINSSLKEKLEITTISDLVNHPELRVGLSYEFIDRQDGWNKLSSFYNLRQKVVALEHGLAYQAIRENKIDITDAYSTDGEINKYNLVILRDDRLFFPSYQAVSFSRNELEENAKHLLSKLTLFLNEKEMQRLNALALYESKSHREIAEDFLVKKGLIRAVESRDSGSLILAKAWRHIELTFLGLIGAMVIAIPLGILIFRNRRASKIILYLAGILQTIPSIALLALMIPFFGIGAVPAVLALFIYALLPILRNTIIGLSTVDPSLKKVASAIGLTTWNRLRMVEIPLAMPTLLAGIRTAAVINVGTATLAAFIGAGGLGEFIVTGLALNNVNMILRGAIPSAILAIVTELIFEAIEKVTLPKQLQQSQL